MGCCGSTTMVPSEPPLPPPAPPRVVSVPVPPQISLEMSPLPSSRPQSQTRSRTKSTPELRYHSRISSQHSNPRISMNSTLQPPQSPRPSSCQNHRTRTKSLAALKKINRSPTGVTSPSRAIQASIENGRSRYWRNLWSNLHLADKPIKDCVNFIHIDIVRIWDLDDRNGYLSSNQFKINMSHVIKDLAVPAGGASSSPDGNDPEDKFARWVYAAYRGSQENVRCLMGYIVNLTVILDGIVRTAAGDTMEKAAQEVMGDHVRSGRRDSIHRDIRRFVEETYPIRFTISQKDLVLEKIIELIMLYCAPPQGNS